jgi:hypothetical protein
MLNICRVVNNLKARKWLATNTLVTGNLAALVEIIGRGVFGRHPILLIGPGTQIDQFAALRAEGAPGVGLAPLHGFLTGGTLYIHGMIPGR